MKIARALYPTDFSTDSLLRVDDAVQYCIENSQELIVLYTYRLINTSNNDAGKYSLKHELDSNADQIFEKIKYTYLSESPINYQLLSEVGFVDDRIAYNIKQLSVNNILLCKSLHDQLEHRISWKEGRKRLFELPIVEL